VEHKGGAFPGVCITSSGVESVGGREFVNDAGFELAALIEDRTWTREALTAPPSDIGWGASARRKPVFA
jgi:hypothetical protein